MNYNLIIVLMVFMCIITIYFVFYMIRDGIRTTRKYNKIEKMNIEMIDAIKNCTTADQLQGLMVVVMETKMPDDKDYLYPYRDFRTYHHLLVKARELMILT